MKFLPLYVNGKMPPKLTRPSVGLALLILLSACATTSQQTQISTNDRADEQKTSFDGAQRQTHVISTLPPIEAFQITNTNAARSAVKPEPKMPPDDLWVRIRRGFELKSYTHKPIVRKWIQFYITQEEHLLGSARRAQPFLWHIVEGLDQHNMPMELALLPIVESGFNPSAQSYAGAAGLWQFMPVTANRFGLDLNWWYDERHAVLPSTKAALNFLQWLHGRYDSWLLALAAYNAGAGRVDEAIEQARKQGRPTNFWHLDLPTQTENFVPKLLALRQIVRKPQAFALDWPALRNKKLTAAISIPYQVGFDRLADMMGVSTDSLLALNTAYRRWATAPSPKHQILVPAERADNLRKALAKADPESMIDLRRYQVSTGDSLYEIAARYDTSVARLRRVNGLSGNVIHPGDQLVLPVGSAPQPASTTQSADHLVVEQGDSLWTIAQRHGTTIEALRRLNNLGKEVVLQPGQKLQVPKANGTHRLAYTVTYGDSLWSIAQNFDVAVADLRNWNDLSKNGVLLPGQTLHIQANNATQMVTYQVQQGDSLWSIASHFSVQVAQIKDWNELANSRLQPGQELRIIVNDATS